MIRKREVKGGIVMRKYLSILLILIMCLVLFVQGCSGAKPEESTVDKEEQKELQTPQEGETEGQEESDDWEGNMSPPGVFPIVKEKVTLRVFVAPEPWIGDFSDNKVTKWYEEKTNVHIEWMQVSRDDAGQKVNLMLASQTDLPDIFMTGLTQAQIITYGSQGILLPLNDYIEKLGVGIKQVFEYDSMVKGMITAPDGNIYGLPEYNECYHCDFSQRMWINQKWLDNLGLKTPETTDEFYEVMVAFRDNDPNGNGKKDEIPISCAPNDWNGSIDGFLMNPFIYSHSTYNVAIMLENDKFSCASIQPGWKEGLKFLRKLYSEGLIDPECFTADTNHLRMLVESEDGCRVGAIPAGSVYFADKTKPTKEEFVPLAPLKGPTGLRQTPQYPTSVSQCFFITNVCKYPEIAFRWGDGQYTLDPIESLAWSGEENVDWRRAKEGEVGLDGRPAVYVPILPYGEPHNSHWGQPHPQIVTNEKRFGQAVPQGEWDHETILYQARKNYYEMYGPKQVIPPLFYSEDVVEEVSELGTALHQYQDECTARFITGDMDIDTEWDKYVEEMKRIGIDRYIEIMQETYDRQYLGK
jgi:putative aldouronate transport system substrate-binding protein